MAKENQMKVDPVFCSINPALFDPKIILDSSDFKVLTDPEEIAECSESNQNIACCYNDKKQVCYPITLLEHDLLRLTCSSTTLSSIQIHMVKKPMPEAHPGQVLLHIRATGICGSDVHFWKHSRVSILSCWWVNSS
jgi:L-iditol 2-dehydrogenase